MKNLKEMVKSNRSFRRFDQSIQVGREELEDLIELARMTASAANRQPLKYYLSSQPETNQKIFNTLSWAGYLKDWDGPEEGEKPTGYIVILGDKTISKNYFCDPGIAAQTILLGAREKDLGGCIFAAISKEELREALSIPTKFEILYVIALGKPAEKVVLEDLTEETGIYYWRDDEQVHHVPKRSVDELIIN
ncbi:MAG: nitroreductase family protein [Bacillota bacterium]